MLWVFLLLFCGTRAGFSTIPHNISVPLGAQVTLVCAGTGSQPVLTRSEHEMLSNELPVEYEAVRSTRLVIDNVQSRDEGWYSCVLGVDVERLYLAISEECGGVRCGDTQTCVLDSSSSPYCTCNIQCSAIHSPVCGTNCAQYYNKCALEADNCKLGTNFTVRNEGPCSDETHVQVVGDPEHVEVVEGSAFSLHCSVIGQDISVRWIHDGVLLPYDHRYEGHTLIVKESTIWDAGQYYCEVSTCGGTKQISSAPATVTVSPRSESLTGPVCTLLGVGHILTFDSYAYKLKRECSYNLMTDCTYGGWFIYAIYSVCPGGVCLESVELIRDKDTILLSRAWEVRVNEVLVPMSLTEPVYLRNMIIRFSGKAVTVEVPGEYLVQWDGLHGLTIVLGKSLSGKVCGLCGNGDSKGYTSNELTGFIYNPKRKAKDFTQFKEQWTVDKSCPNVEVEDTMNCKGRYSRTCAKIFRQLFKGCSYYSEAHFFLAACNEFSCLKNERPGGGIDGFTVECQVGEAMARWCESHGGFPGLWRKRSKCPSECGIRQAVLNSIDCDVNNGLLEGCS